MTWVVSESVVAINCVTSVRIRERVQVGGKERMRREEVPKILGRL